MRVVGLAGWSGAGKTTLLLKLIPELRSRGLAVSTLKHAHHAFDVDYAGKDSHRHREAGAREVLVSSGRRWALMHELDGEAEPPLPALLERLSAVDLVLVEGFKNWSHPKIEVHRLANRKPFLFPHLAGIRGLASDDPAAAAAPVPVLALDDVAGIADLMLATAEPRAELILGLVEHPPVVSAAGAGRRAG